MRRSPSRGCRPRGRLAIVGLGPGARDLLTPRAVAELGGPASVIGPRPVPDQVRDLLRPGAVLTRPGSAPRRRARTTPSRRPGPVMRSRWSAPATPASTRWPARPWKFAGDDIDVVGVPGVTATSPPPPCSARRWGTTTSSSSCRTCTRPGTRSAPGPRGGRRRLRRHVLQPAQPGTRLAAGEALGILAGQRPPGRRSRIVRDAAGRTSPCSSAPSPTRSGGRRHAQHVIVGNRNTGVIAGRMVTPRGYRWLG